MTQKSVAKSVKFGNFSQKCKSMITRKRQMSDKERPIHDVNCFLLYFDTVTTCYNSGVNLTQGKTKLV